MDALDPLLARGVRRPDDLSGRSALGQAVTGRMIPSCRIDERDPHARGTAIGTAWRERIGAGWQAYERLFGAAGAGPRLQREVAERSLERTRSWAPALADEITGIAAGAGLEPWRVAALNARTEVLAAAGAATAGECSTFVVAPPGGGPPRTIQTWDWYEDLRDNVLLLTVETGPGGAVHLFTEFGIVGKIGVNEAGLGLHFNILHHAADGGAPGVPVHVVARRILDDASDGRGGDRAGAIGDRLGIDGPHRRRLGRRARECPLPRALSRRRRRAGAGRRRRARPHQPLPRPRPGARRATDRLRRHHPRPARVARSPGRTAARGGRCRRPRPERWSTTRAGSAPTPATINRPISARRRWRRSPSTSPPRGSTSTPAGRASRRGRATGRSPEATGPFRRRIACSIRPTTAGLRWAM